MPLSRLSIGLALALTVSAASFAQAQDAPQTTAQLQNLLRDGQPSHSITPQIMRDLAVSVLNLQDGGTVSGPTAFSNKLTFSGSGHPIMPTWGTAPETTAGAIGYNSTTGRWEFGIGGSVVNHVRLSGDTMTGALHMGANTLDGSAVAFSGGTIDGTAVGPTTPASGSFTSLRASGNATFGGTLYPTATTPLSDATEPVQIMAPTTGQIYFGANKGSANHGILLGYNTDGAFLGGVGAYLRNVASDPIFVVTGSSTVAAKWDSSGFLHANQGEVVSGGLTTDKIAWPNGNLAFTTTVTPSLSYSTSLTGTVTSAAAYLNQIAVANDSIDAHTATNGLSALAITDNMGGATYQGSRTGLTVQLQQNGAFTASTTQPQNAAIAAWAFAGAYDNKNAIWYGLYPQVVIPSGASNVGQAVGMEIDVSNQSTTTGTVTGFQIVPAASWNQNGTGGVDSAMVFGSQGSTAVWKYGIRFGGATVAQAFGASSTLIYSAHSMSISSGIDWSNVTVSGNWFNFGTVASLSGAGALNVASYSVGGTAGVTCSGTPTASYAVTNGIVTHC